MYTSTSSSAAAAAASAANKRKLPSSPPSSSPSPPSKKLKPLPTPRLSHLLSLLSSSLSLSRSFLTSLDTSPPLSLPLHSSLLSASFSFSRLLSLLPLPLQSLPLSIPIPPPSPPSWFLRILSSSNPAAFPQSFHVTRDTFHSLLQSLQLPFSSLPCEHRLGIALFRLAHAAPFHTIASRFGLSSPAQACRAFYEVCRAVTVRLCHLFGFESDVSVLTQGFHHLSLPNCCGVLGYARFPIKHPNLGGSVIAQALVDSNGRFVDVSVGWHGAMKPAQILPRTNMYETNLVSSPRYVLGGSCCPLLPWLMTPYQIKPESPPSHAVFNQVHACGMEVASKAFGRVKDRWRLLAETWKEGQAEALPYVVVAGCLLHNFLESCGDPVSEKVVLGTDAAVPKQLSGFAEFEGEFDEAGGRMRDALASHLLENILGNENGLTNKMPEQFAVYTNIIGDQHLNLLCATFGYKPFLLLKQNMPQFH